MEIIKPKTDGAIKICQSCGSILNFNGEDVKIETKGYVFTHRYIVCPVCKNKIEL